MYAREERSKRRINSPRFGRLKKYAGNCERPAAGGWLARDGSRGRRESSRKLVRTLVSDSIWVQIFLQKYIYIRELKIGLTLRDGQK